MLRARQMSLALLVIAGVVMTKSFQSVFGPR
jgi:hypothetical protein